MRTMRLGFIGLLGLVLGLAQWSAAPVTAQAQQARVEDFAALPNFHLPALSPDGRRVAFISNSQGERILTVYDFGTGEQTGAIVSEIRPHNLRWASNRVVLLSASEATRFVRYTGRYDFSAVFAFDIQNDMTSRQLLESSARTGLNVNMGRIEGIHDATGRVLIPARDTRRSLDLFGVDPLSRGVSTMASGTASTVDWVIDDAGEPIARIEYDQERNLQRLRVQRDGNWEIIAEDEDAERMAYSAVGLLANGDLGVTTLFSGLKEDVRRGLYSVSLETGEFNGTVFEHDTYDLDTAIRDPYTNRVVGASYHSDMLEIEWIDTELAEIAAHLTERLPDVYPLIRDWSEDRQKILLSLEYEFAPREYYLFDRQSGQFISIMSQYPQLDELDLPTRMSIEYPARDGVRVPAYLTLPAGEGPHPTVVLPHGGPAARDTGGFDYLAHFLAARGYMVVQPNFRGSEGYGRDWEEAGHGEWGMGVMQHDVTDAAAALVTAGYADADRICILGASYGGYAALAGAAFTPDQYQCAAAIAPVTDIQTFLRFVRERGGRHHWAVDYWNEAILDDNDEARRQNLRRLSPRFHAEAIEIPVLLIHGQEDTVVPITQSENMRDALRRAGKQVEFIRMDEGDHWLTSASTRETVLDNVIRFLDTHIGGE